MVIHSPVKVSPLLISFSNLSNPTFTPTSRCMTPTFQVDNLYCIVLRAHSRISCCRDGQPSADNAGVEWVLKGLRRRAKCKCFSRRSTWGLASLKSILQGICLLVLKLHWASRRDVDATSTQFFFRFNMIINRNLDCNSNGKSFSLIEILISH